MKQLETILWFANKLSDEPNKYKISYLIYLSDKTSLERYARFASGFKYFAGEHYPIQDTYFSLLNNQKDLVLKNGGVSVIPKRLQDNDEFSDSDLSCFKLTLELFGKLPTWYLRQLARDEVWRSKNNGDDITELDIVTMFNETKDYIKYLTDQ